MNRDGEPRVCRRALLAVVLAGLFGGQPLAAASFRDHGSPVEVAVYDFEVAAMCGLVTGAVHRGFRHHLQGLVEAAGMDRESFEAARMRGWTAADREWANRGLGGFRGWCRGEGESAAARFATHDPGTRGQPGSADDLAR